MISQLMRSLWASLDIMNPNLSVCGEESSGCPEYNMDSPLASLTCSDWRHLVSHRPRRDILHLLNSSVITAFFPLAYMFLTVRVAMLMDRLGVRRSRRTVFHVHHHFLFSLDTEESSFPRLWEFLVFIDVSVAWMFFMGRGCYPQAQPSTISGLRCVLELNC